MGSGLSTIFPCLVPANRTNGGKQPDQQQYLIPSEPLDETLGHSFYYVRSSGNFLSTTDSDRFLSPSNSLRFDEPVGKSRAGSEIGFKAISGASVSANTATPRTVLLDEIYGDTGEFGVGMKGSIVNGFESTSSFCALPLQPVPRGGEPSGLMERGGFFLSGPIERSALSGPLDVNNGLDSQVPFSAPLGGAYGKKKKKRKGVPRIPKAFYRSFSERNRPWVVPVLNFVNRKDVEGEPEVKSESNVQWALGKAGEDRVHVVVSEEHGWLFVGIYDGFNGPDAPEFLMGNLYRSVYHELQGLFWELDQGEETSLSNLASDNVVVVGQDNPSIDNSCGVVVNNGEDNSNVQPLDREQVKKVTFQSQGVEVRRMRLMDFLAQDQAVDGHDLSGSDRFAFSVDALKVSNAGSGPSSRWLSLSRLKNGFSKHKEGQGRKLFPWKFGLDDSEKVETDNKLERLCRSDRKRKIGSVDHELVLSAMSRALTVAELAYLDMTDKVLDTNPELALMGSCLLVVLMRDEDVYVMNLGDSRAIVAQLEIVNCSTESKGEGNTKWSMQSTDEELKAVDEVPAEQMGLTALQLSTDHSTSIEEEVLRIKNEHPDDKNCIINNRVKGRLKVTRAFGAGSLKLPKLNDALLEMFRNEYIGTAPYLSCYPSLRHHKLCQKDQFLILSSDGLYQYLSNQEVVSHVESFMEKFPEGDPAQNLIEELLSRAAKKAGMDFHELLDIPHGDRRKYHDDVTVMVISLEGRIWKSSGKYL